MEFHRHRRESEEERAHILSCHEVVRGWGGGEGG